MGFTRPTADIFKAFKSTFDKEYDMEIRQVTNNKHCVLNMDTHMYLIDKAFHRKDVQMLSFCACNQANMRDQDHMGDLHQKEAI